MRKEWIRTEEERRLRKIKRIYKQMNQDCHHPTIQRKKNKFHLLSNQFSQYKQPVCFLFIQIDYPRFNFHRYFQ
jgi:hypothetical protein